MQSLKHYQQSVRALLSPAERRVFAKLSSPQKIQDYLDSFPINFGSAGEATIKSPLKTLTARKMHCMEGALVAAASLAYHGRAPLLMDIQSTDFDLDHVIALFQENGLWGAISKTNHHVLRWRDPVYKTPRELAMSYAHEYFWPDAGKNFGAKTMRAYSAPFDLLRYKPGEWLGAEELDWLAEDLDSSRHFPIAPPKAIKKMRPASKLEAKAWQLAEWPEPK